MVDHRSGVLYGRGYRNGGPCDDGHQRSERQYPTGWPRCHVLPFKSLNTAAIPDRASVGSCFVFRTRCVAVQCLPDFPTFSDLFPRFRNVFSAEKLASHDTASVQVVALNLSRPGFDSLSVDVPLQNLSWMPTPSQWTHRSEMWNPIKGNHRAKTGSPCNNQYFLITN